MARSQRAGAPASMDVSTMRPIDNTLTSVPPATTALGQRHGAAGATAPVGVSVIMPTIFWTGTFERCARRLLALLDRSRVPSEAVFVFDGAAPPAPRWLDRPDVRIVSTGTAVGPATARNAAAETARGRVLFFVDADVELADDAIDRVGEAFDTDPDMVGMFGAYDDEPAAGGLVSSFRNLLHHHTHVAHRGDAGTFWTGCGAIRTAAFRDAGGFDETGAHPNVEDVELGMRIADQGGRIVLDPRLHCKSLKRWTLMSMLFSDIAHRAQPWTRLIVNSRRLPATLNIDWRGRLSGVCAMLLCACLVAAAFTPLAAWAAATLVLALVAINRDFYRLCLRKRGLPFTTASFALHTLYFVYASITFGCVVLARLCRGSSRADEGLAPPATRPRLAGTAVAAGHAATVAGMLTQVGR